MFTAEQIMEKLSVVKTGADFPALAAHLKNLGVTYYETKMEDGRSVYHGKDGYELLTGTKYSPIAIAEEVNVKQLKADIENHQQGKSDYFQISRQSARNGIDKWAVCLFTMTCTYLDKAGNKVCVEQIPEAASQKLPFTIEQIKAAHSKVKSGADFPAYIKDIKALGVSRYETFVVDGHTDYYAANGQKISNGPGNNAKTVAERSNAEKFKTDLKAHQQGQTSYPAFCNDCAASGIEKWAVSISEMTCTYFDKEGKEVLIEEIPT
jgi:uncharacterized protein YbcV (DUF1398 family)